MLIEKHGVTSFKIYMFYGGYGLHGASSHQHEFLMIDEHEKYDIAHFEFVMRGIQRAMERFPDRRDSISRQPALRDGRDHGRLHQAGAAGGQADGAAAYSAARPPHSEGLAICIASYLAHETECLNINLLHLTSRKAVEAALKMAKAFPQVNFRREVTVGHLLLDYDAPTGVLAKVNPPIRSRDDVEYLWKTLLAGKLDWVCSDHACCRHEMKVDGKKPGEVFLGKSGFGGTEYLLSGLASEGRKRGLSWNRMAELTSLECRAALRPARARATLPPGSTRTSCSSTLTSRSSCARPSPSRRRATRRSRAWNSPGRWSAPICAAISCTTRARSSARRPGAISAGRTDHVDESAHVAGPSGPPFGPLPPGRREYVHVGSGLGVLPRTARRQGTGTPSRVGPLND